MIYNEWISSSPVVGSFLLNVSDTLTFNCFVCRLSRRGRTVIFSIHQPRFTIFKLFDRLTLLAAGHSAFHGPASQALSFFESLGLRHDMFYHCIFAIDNPVCPSVCNICALRRNDSTILHIWNYDRWQNNIHAAKHVFTMTKPVGLSFVRYR